MRNFNRKLFVTASMIVGLLVVVSLFSTLEKDAGHVGSNFLMVFLGGLFEVLRFPAHTLLGNLAGTSTLLFCGGLIVNCLFYGLLAERIFALIRTSRTRNLS